MSSISGCASTIKTIKTPPETIVKIQTVEVKKPALSVQQPDALRSRDVTWVVITEGNFEAKMAELKAKGISPAFFALTPNGYENLSLNTNDLRAYIAQQKSIIAAYEKYYK